MAGLHEVGDDRDCLNNMPSSCSLIVELIIVTKTDPELGVVRVHMQFDAYRVWKLRKGCYNTIKKHKAKDTSLRDSNVRTYGFRKITVGFYSVRTIG